MNPFYPVILPKPASCNHKEFRINENTSRCGKCGRIRVVSANKTIFKFLNGVIYLTLNNSQEQTK